MNRKTKLSLVSSTPHITKTVKLNSLFENDAISPVVLNVGENRGPSKRPKTALNKADKPNGENEVTAKRIKCLPIKEKGSVRSTALKERRVNMKASSSNTLSMTTRQNSNSCYQPLIILDSDEEADFQLTTEKILPQKKSILKQPPISLQRLKEVDRRKRPEQNVDESNNLKEYKGATKEKPATITHQTPQSSSTRSRIVKKQPLSNLANITTPNKKVQESKGKPPAVKNRSNKIPITENVDTEDSIFCDSVLPVNISTVKKKKFLELSSLEEIVGKDAIKWTPRSKGTKRVINKKVNNKKENGVSDDCVNSNTIITEQISRTIVKEEPKENVDNKMTINVPIKSEAENNLSKELFSCFADVVFKQSKKHEGCVIGSSLVSGSLDFGYLELDGDKSFTGKLPNVTYVLLEGSVLALLQGKTQNLEPGDILHIQDDSGYELQNLQSSHARFLYVRQKQRT